VLSLGFADFLQTAVFDSLLREHSYPAGNLQQKSFKMDPVCCRKQFKVKIDRWLPSRLRQ